MSAVYSVAHAADPVSEGVGAVDAHYDDHHKEVEGLPQLDFTTYTEQIFWLFVFFIILYVFFSKKTLPEVSSTIERRKEQIQGDLDNAESLREDADKVQQAYEDILSDARTKSTDAFSAMETEIKAKNEKQLAAFKERSLKATEKTEASIEAAKSDAIGDMNSIAAEVASIAAQKIVGVSTDIDKAKDLVKTIGRKAA